MTQSAQCMLEVCIAVHLHHKIGLQAAAGDPATRFASLQQRLQAADAADAAALRAARREARALRKAKRGALLDGEAFDGVQLASADESGSSELADEHMGASSDDSSEDAAICGDDSVNDGPAAKAEKCKHSGGGAEMDLSEKDSLSAAAALVEGSTKHNRAAAGGAAARNGGGGRKRRLAVHSLAESELLVRQLLDS